MTQTTKMILIIIGSVLALCACTAIILAGTGLWGLGKVVQFAEDSTTEDPQEVARIASEIAEFKIPEGFTTEYGVQIGTFSMVQYTAPSREAFIFLTQFPAGTSINPDEMLRQIRNNSKNPNSPWHNVDTELVEQKPVTIRGDECMLSISEGTSDQGIPYRMIHAKFQGNGDGPAVLMIVGPVNHWDMQMAEDFIASIQ